MPQVNIILPAYNAEKFIGAALDSLLNQTFEDFEIFVINDASLDNTAAICQAYADSDPRIRLIHNPGNKGVTKTLNRGLELATAPLVARMDADDIAMPNRLERQVAYMSENPDVGVVSSWIRPTTSEGKIYTHFGNTPSDDDYLDWAFLFKNPIAHPAVMFRTELVRSVGGYGQEETLVEDYELWSKLHQKTKIHIIPEQLLIYHIHAQSVSNRNTIRQSLAATRVAKFNIENFLGQPVDFNATAVIHYAGLSFQTAYKQADILAAINLLEALYSKFTMERSLKPETLAYVHGDLHELLQPILLSLPLNERLSILRGNRFVKTVLDRKALLASVYDWKKTGRALLGKKAKLVIPEPNFQLINGAGSPPKGVSNNSGQSARALLSGVS